MNSRPMTPLHIAIRCDALSRSGTGHLLRQLALAEELLQRGHAVSLVGTSDMPWAIHQASRVGLSFVEPGADLPAQLEDMGCDTVVIDGYDYPASMGESLRAAGFPVLTMVDGDFGRHQVADVYVDQNLGTVDPELPNWLVGPSYVLLRDVVRGRHERVETHRATPKVLVVFGGSDPFSGCPVAVELLLETKMPLDIVAIAASDERREALERLVCGEGQTLLAVGPQDDLPALAVTCDFVVSAAGSSVWELACLGIPTALVCVTDNQLLGYQAATDSLAVPIGHLERLRIDAEARAEAVLRLRRLAREAAWRRELARRGRELVDGQGRQRVADVLEGREQAPWTAPGGRRPESQGPWVLGTVQLGVPYGAANRDGQPTLTQARHLLTLAADLGVTHFDTARAYGTSEAALGFALRRGLGQRVGLITKIQPLDALGDTPAEEAVAAAVCSSARASFEALGVQSVDTLLTHRWQDWVRGNGAGGDALEALRAEGAAARIGVSLSTPEELMEALADPRIGYVQLPFNLLDRRWLREEVQAALATRPDVVITVRSVFLQGLLAVPDQARWPALPGAEGFREALRKALQAVGAPSMAAMALSYVRAQPWVHSVVLGAERAWQVRDQAQQFELAPLDAQQLQLIHEIVDGAPVELVNPALWPR